MSWCAAIRQPGLKFGILPVSYTHLDVYKRQVEKDMIDSVAYKITNQIDEMIQKLSDSDKDLIRNKFFYAKSYSEIAKESFSTKSVIADRVNTVLKKMIRDCRKPVSYTHLDVYKRQVQ